MSQQLQLTTSLDVSQQRTLDSITSILANKYTRQDESWPPLVELACGNMKTALADLSGSESTTQFRTLQIGLSFAAGALPNYDKHLQKLVHMLIEVPSHPTLGLYAAREFGTLVVRKAELTPENHAVSKRLWKQWTYTQLVKPMLEKAFPFDRTLPEGHNYAVAVMSILKHLPFEIYEDDGDSVVRIAIPALTSLGVGPDVEASLKILLQVLENKPEVLKQRINAIVKSALELYEKAKDGAKEEQGGSVAGLVTRVNPPAYRKLALELIARLPLKFEERHLLSYVAKLQRLLSLACGDSVREVRQAALKARVNWATVN